MGTAMTDKQNELIVRLRNLKLEGFASEIENQLSNLPVYAKLSFEDRLLSCVDIQETLNKEKRCFTLIKNAKFKDHLRLTDLTSTADYGLKDETLASLTSLNWVTKCCNVIISGSCGVGKTGLACALGYNCCSNGISVRYYRTSDLLLEMSNKLGMDKLRFMRNLQRFKVLILDDFGISKISTSESQDLFNIIDDRYKTASTVISTQLKKRAFPILLGSDTKAEAATDRLLHPAIEIELKGPSRRK